MLKEKLRLNYTKRREKVSEDILLDQSLIITNNVLNLPIWDYSFYHIFLRIPKKKEIFTEALISILQGKDKNVVLPKISENNTLSHYLLTDDTVLRTNHWGIPEPENGIEVPIEKIDVVFIPLLAFDEQGHRVGYGKGFYDDFLSNCKKDVLKIGLSLFEAEHKITDVRENDILMDYCVTPYRIYEF